VEFFYYFEKNLKKEICNKKLNFTKWQKFVEKKIQCNRHTNFSCANQCICGIYSENMNKLPLEC